jgi:hypothetical protein
MVFGSDGKLYIAVGDGANPQTGQDLNTTLGKVLRLYPDAPVATSDADKLEEVRIMPQPASNMATLWIKNEGTRMIRARLHHINGQEVWRGLFQHTQPMSSHNIQVSQLPAGLYILQLQHNLGQQSPKLLVK